ncbi:MAG: DUF350 domain-containing protein [Cytophagales bacterium]|nr:DUF350 domain-containing protein [Bernardetiaceae bacterium]MDW8206063.1 DUF350 domain-containing protein [Cytophagales bacterium]
MINHLLTILLQATKQFYEVGILGTLIFSAIGILMSVVAFKIIDWLIPGKMTHQIADEKNVAIGIVAGAMILGICIIIAAAIVG